MSTNPAEVAPSATGSSGRSGHASAGRGRSHRKGRQGVTYIHRSLANTPERSKPRSVKEEPAEGPSRLPKKPPGLSSPSETPMPADSTPASNADSEGELCFICGNFMNERYYSLAPCNKAFCHNCSLRLRSLYKSTNCPFCKVLSTSNHSC
jgi:E3 ubiquitin-protein ligase ZNF598